MFGPTRDRSRHALQNVKFVKLLDNAGFPHIFWRCIRPIPEGEALWGDYDDDYWKSDTAAESEPILSAMMRRLLLALRGRSEAFPLVVHE